MYVGLVYNIIVFLTREASDIIHYITYISDTYSQGPLSLYICFYAGIIRLGRHYS